MTPILVALFAFACMFAGTRGGMFLRNALPEHHLTDDSKEVVRLGMGLIATLTALVLGLVTASAKSAFDQQTASVQRAAADILTLDRALADYGPETKASRDELRDLVQFQLDHIWQEGMTRVEADVLAGTQRIEALAASLRALEPHDDGRRELKSRAITLGDDIQEARWMRLENQGHSIPTPFLVIVIFWLTVLFGSFGLFAPRNATVAAVLLLCAMSSSASIFLILELEHPFDGVVRVTSAPMHYTLDRLGQ